MGDFNRNRCLAINMIFWRYMAAELCLLNVNEFVDVYNCSIFVVLTGLTTMGAQAIKASLANPSKTEFLGK